MLMVHVNITWSNPLLAKAKLTVKRKKIFAGFSLALFALMLVGLLFVMERRPADDTTELVAVDEIQSRALDYVDKDDADGGLKYYDQHIKDAQDEETRKYLLLRKSDFAQRMGRVDEALDAAQEADGISSDFATSQMLAIAHEAKGNNGQAIEYYSKMIDMSSDNEMEASYNSLWKKKIEELQQ